MWSVVFDAGMFTSHVPLTIDNTPTSTKCKSAVIHFDEMHGSQTWICRTFGGARVSRQRACRVSRRSRTGPRDVRRDVLMSCCGAVGVSAESFGTIY